VYEEIIGVRFPARANIFLFTAASRPAIISTQTLSSSHSWIEVQDSGFSSFCPYTSSLGGAQTGTILLLHDIAIKLLIYKPFFYFLLSFLF
jgi:hypothetical protein